jgi:hypothetical protein
LMHTRILVHVVYLTKSIPKGQCINTLKSCEEKRTKIQSPKILE